MDLSIIIVNYKSSVFLTGCLNSISASELNIGHEVIVVDNNSMDEGLVEVKRGYPAVNFIDLRVNRGFAAGNNAGIKLAQGKVILLLNPDTVVNKNTIQCLYEKVNSKSEIGIIGPKTYYEDGRLENRFIAKKQPSLSGFFYEMFYLDKLFSCNKKINSYYGANFDYEKGQYLEVVSGACFMIKREVIDKIGLMDEKFFLYCEEIDWCLRAIQAGYKVFYEPSAAITHFGGKSSAMNRRKGVEMFYESSLYFFRKHYGKFKTTLLYFLNFIGFSFRLLTIPVYLLKDKNFNKVTRHYWALLYHLNISNLLRALRYE